MKTKAAIAYAAGKPLEVVTVELGGPKAGEVLVEIRASGVCHTDEFTRSGADPEGLSPVIFGHEGAGIVVDVGLGVTSLKKGDHVIPLYTPECRPFQLVTGRVWKGTAFGGARGRTDVPKIVDWYMDRKINIDDLITHVMPLEKINDAFDLMRRCESIRSVVTF